MNNSIIQNVVSDVSINTISEMNNNEEVIEERKIIKPYNDNEISFVEKSFLVSGQKITYKIKIIDNMVVVFNPDGRIDEGLSRKFKNIDDCYSYQDFIWDILGNSITTINLE